MRSEARGQQVALNHQHHHHHAEGHTRVTLLDTRVEGNELSRVKLLALARPLSPLLLTGPVFFVGLLFELCNGKANSSNNNNNDT